MKTFFVAVVVVGLVAVCSGTAAAQSFCTSGSCGVQSVVVSNGFSSFVQPSITVASSPVFFEPSIVTVPTVVQQVAPVVVQQRFHSGGSFSVNANVSPLRARLQPTRTITSRPGLFGTRVLRIR